MSDSSFSSTAAFIWSVADLLRGDYKQSDYGKIILPFTLLRRLECVLEPTRDKVITKHEQLKDSSIPSHDFLVREAEQSFYNTSKLALATLGQKDIGENLVKYVDSFSEDARDVFERFKFRDQIDFLAAKNLLYQIVEKFKNIDLHPETIDNYHMGLVFEELIRRFAEASNETAGEHFTPRDIVRLTTSLVLMPDDEAIAGSGVIRTIYDPTSGTGGFLSTATEYVHELNSQAVIRVFGQELNDESYAICKADMMIKGQDVSNIKQGNTLSEDKLWGEKFDYMLSNPPFGVEWKKVQKVIQEEHTQKGYDGRFGPGLPRVSDGSLLFLMHLISKMHDSRDGTSRIGIILNGSPLFTGGAGSGESEIRRYILERDLLETIVALPTDMFYNTGIATYIWILSNNKSEERKGKVQLVNATELFAKMRKSLGSKRNYLTEEHIAEITRTVGNFVESDTCKVFANKSFGYRRITVERPLQLKFAISEEKINELTQEKAWGKIKGEIQKNIINALEQLVGKEYNSREQFMIAFEQVREDKKLSASQLKFVWSNLGERCEDAEICRDKKGKIEADSELRDHENVTLTENIEEYFAREVKPHVPQAWIDEKKKDDKDGLVGVVGYEIPFNRHFYKYTPPRSLQEIDHDLDQVTKKILELLKEVHS
ncbi:type I restriction-modification system subunit M [Candidatus Uabimicrobium amorphum]|uniref:site-specific DNA-methyltransferase (adenine-specific) n=1 Tax=Uabimicrobium amorphum TaxID=2596890 RepID=A0A5S9F5T1_UABAM|nr:class I SAM-dependent DNA methyltransferase [Candidatus Uabimicrobium amorphum]BBM86641.1 restriction endonuclease subunit M [Candidatus Uabimicrobium amorphum]